MCSHPLINAPNVSQQGWRGDHDQEFIQEQLDTETQIAQYIWSSHAISWHYLMLLQYNLATPTPRLYVWKAIYESSAWLYPDHGQTIGIHNALIGVTRVCMFWLGCKLTIPVDTALSTRTTATFVVASSLHFKAHKEPCQEATPTWLLLYCSLIATSSLARSISLVMSIIRLVTSVEWSASYFLEKAH